MAFVLINEVKLHQTYGMWHVAECSVPVVGLRLLNTAVQSQQDSNGSAIS